ncbi:MAG: hypothetical protein ACJA0N_001859 [Pseudohongiellaceae bacterium]|jgi:hypothetical protein
MKRFLVLVFLLMSNNLLAQQGQFMTADELQTRYFSEATPLQTLWVNKAMRSEIEAIVGRRFTTLRMRYWGENQRTAWILEEIGKERPITVGVVVEGGEILNVSMLEYRESRGGEVRYPFFTRQFQQVRPVMRDGYQLNKNIDGITGATLSVRALKKIATLSLFYHQQTPFAQPVAKAGTTP